MKLFVTMYLNEVQHSLTSEDFHELEVNHFTNKVNYRRKLSERERSELNTAIRNFPNKNHTPVGFNKI